MRSLILVTILLLIGKISDAQIQKDMSKTEDSIKNVINDLFTGMLNADSLQIARTFSKTAVLQTIGKNKDGSEIIKDEKVSAFAGSISKLKKGDAEERIVFNSILIDGPLASVWTPYQFIFKGVYSHQGVDSFQLVRIDGEWKIQYLIDTKRK